MSHAQQQKISHLTLVHAGPAGRSPAPSASLDAGSALTSGNGLDAGRETEPINILLVEDNPADRRLVAERLGSRGNERFHLLFAERISEALQTLAQNKVALILLDLQLPDSSNLESLIKIHAAATGIPIVVLSEIEDETLAIKALQLGAQDFLVKWHTNEHLLVRAVQYALERKQAEEHLYYLAHHDALTGLPNRKLFYDELKQRLATARRHNRSLAIMFIDLGNFKFINDTLGHHCGDLLLQMVGKRLASCVRATDCLGRIGGDEFIVALTDMNHPQQDAAAAANKILEIFHEPFLVENHVVHARASLGISLYPTDGDDIESLVRNADLAMYRAKSEANNDSRYWFYAPEFNARTSDLLAIEKRFQQALEQDEFVIYYQPQIDLRHGHLIGMEALLRWHHPEHGMLMPSQFLPELEESGFMTTLGTWVLREACRQNRAWQDAGHPPLVVAVNISSQELRHQDFPGNLKLILDETGLDPRWLELEIRECSIEENEALAFEQLSRVNALGTRIALDNIGHSSIPLNFLSRFPIHSIKIDRAIVSDVDTDTSHAAVARAVIAVAHVLNIKGLAEGVERQEQLNFLKTEQCDDAQGYMFGKPLPSAACSELFGTLRTGGNGA